MPQLYMSKYLLNKTINATVESILFGLVPQLRVPNSESSRKEENHKQYDDLDDIKFESSMI